MIDKPLPANIGAEKTILGAILLDNGTCNEASDLLCPDDFYLLAHRKIFDVMLLLNEKKCAIDCITVGELLGQRKESEMVGGVAFITTLMEGVPHLPSVAEYAKIVKGNALRRQVIKIADMVCNKAFDRGVGLESLIASFETETSKIIKSNITGAKNRHIQTWEQIPTLDQLPDVDTAWLVEGLIPASGITLWAGESGCYKSFIALNLCKAIIEGQAFLGRKTVRCPVLYLDRENPSSLIKDRLSILGIPTDVSFRYWGGWHEEQPPSINDHRLLELVKKNRPLIIIDSFIRFHGSDENSATEMGRVMAQLRGLANAGATILMLHHKPKAEGTMYRGSGDIKAGVDCAFAITKEKDSKTIRMEGFKNRFGEDPSITIQQRLNEGLGFVVTEDPAIQEAMNTERILQRIIEVNPGESQQKIIDLAQQEGIPNRPARIILDRKAGELWKTVKGARGRLSYYPNTYDSSFSAFQPFISENLKSSNEGALDMLEGEL